MNGQEIINYITEITPDKDNLPDYFFDILSISNADFKLKTVDISDILKCDEGLNEYVNSKEQRYMDQDDDYFPEPDDIDNPIVILDDEVMDGYNRTSTKYWNGDYEIDAYVGYSSEYEGKKTFENKKLYAGQLKVSKDIDKKLKKEQGKSEEYKEAQRKKQKDNYYMKLQNKNKVITTIKEFKSVENDWKDIVKLSDKDTVLHGEATIRDIIDYFEPELTHDAVISTTDYNELYEYKIDLKTNTIKIIDLKADKKLEKDFEFKPASDITTEDLKGIHKKLASKQNILVKYINESIDYTSMSKEELLDNILNKAQEAINHLKEANNLIGNISILCKVNNIPNSEELKDYQDFHNAYSIQNRKLGMFIYNNKNK